MALPLLIFILLKLIALVKGKQEAFIIGGNYAHVKDFPHVAFLAISCADGEYTCGSSILNQMILISAAHCMDNPLKIVAFVGNANRDQGIAHTAKTFKVHENWDEVAIKNDISLISLEKPIRFGPYVKRVVMIRNPPKSGKAEVAGWGAVEEKDYTDTTTLKHTEQDVWTNQQCKKVLHSVVPPGTICGGRTHATGKYASRGDSGSGLVLRHHIIIGLVSFKDTSVSRSLVIYTDVPYFFNWIKTNAERLAKQRCH